MLPSEFYGTYGPPVVRVVLVPLGDVFRIPPSEHRYLLAIISSSDTCNIVPTELEDTNFGLGNFANGEGMFAITHALHGSLVNIGWTIQSVSGAADVRVAIAEGIMYPGGVNRKGKSNAKSTQKQNGKRAGN